MNNVQSAILSISLTLSFSGCKYSRLDDADQGIWISEAYGSAIHIIADSITHYEFTPDYCIRTETKVMTKTQHEKSYEVIDDELFVFTYPGFTDKNKDYGITYESSQDLPASCANNVIDVTSGNDVNHPERDLEIFLQTFEQYYYDFDTAGVDWTLVEQQARSTVTSQTTTKELFKIMSDAIAPLQNGHVYILDEENLARYRQSQKPVLLDRLYSEFLDENHLTPPLSDSENVALANYIENNEKLIQTSIISYLDYSQLSYAANNNIIWGKHDNFGYLHIASFNDFTATNDHAETQKIMHQIMQQVMRDFDTTDGLIIDLRFNGGGYAYLSRILAGYFTSHEQLGYIKSARYGSDFTPEQYIYISSEIQNYTKPVMVLISNTTASAAELAVLMLSTLDHVTLIGEETQGMLSGSLTKTLPNGFKFGISNMKQLSSERISFEQQGIPAAIETSFTAKEDRLNLVDKGLEAAFNRLESITR